MPASLAIHRLSARTPALAQPVAARLALQALGADLEDALPRGLPPQALLWLRRLQLQAPEAALLRPAPLAWRQDWIAAGRQQMDAALAQAARPALGPVPDSAPAVLFADAAEMLACLALAAQGGQMDRWWWRGLLGRAWPQAQAAWAARPEAQAGALRLLARVGQGGLAGAWSEEPPQATPTALPATPLAVRVGDEARAAAARQAAVEPRASIVRQPDEAPTDASPRSAAGDRITGAELHRQLPRAREPAASPPAALVLTEPSSPPAASGGPAAFADRPREAPVDAAPAGTVPPRHARAPQPARHDGPATEPPQPASLGQAPALAGESLPSAPQPSRPRRPAAKAGAAEPRELPSARRLVVEPATAISPDAVGHDGSPERMAAALLVAEPSAPIDEQPAAWPWPHALLSRHAPLLFIVNALLEDGLYPDFTCPRDPGLPVPLWALLPALARAWRLPGDELESALRQRCPDWTAPDTMPAAPGAPAGPWPDWLAAYARCLRRRLCRRLGLRPAAWPQALTLARPARLWCSEAEWVAEFDLGDHDVAWRLAGLDRDPGWLPSAGVGLRFVFVV